MTHVGYIVAAYLVTFGAIAAYAAWVLARSRAVGRALDAQGTDPGPSSVERAGPDR